MTLPASIRPCAQGGRTVLWSRVLVWMRGGGGDEGGRRAEEAGLL